MEQPVEQTMREKMLSGQPFSSDAGLVEDKVRSRALVTKFNSLTPGSDNATAVLKDLMGSLGKGVYIEPPFSCDYGFYVHLGDNVRMSFNCVILDVCEVHIGARTILAPNVQIYGATHSLDPVARSSGGELGKHIVTIGKTVRIGEDVWIGGGAIIRPGVTIGDCAVVGAGAVVTKDVPPRCVVAGSPARIIKYI